MSLIDDIVTYSELFGPSGEEDRVIRLFTSDLETLGIETTVDALGNVIAPLTRAVEGYPTVMISAHLDEIGFVIRKIEDTGFLRVHRVGGVNDRVIAGQRLVFMGKDGPVQGVVGVKAKHVSSPEELRAIVGVDEACVDIMIPSKQAVIDLGLTVGSLGTFTGQLVRQGDYIQGKALDNRVGVALLLEIARRLQDVPVQVGVTLVATVQEEFSVRGGVTAARTVAPDFALCLDVAIATDTPDLTGLGSVSLGGGPVITRFTRASLNGIIPNPKLWRFAQSVATKEGIETQFGVLQGGLTDGSFMQYELGGIPTLDLSFPTRYTHTAVETCHLRDIERCADLAIAILEDVPGNFDLARGKRV